MKTTRRYTDDQFIQAVKLAFSIAQTLKMLGLDVSGGNYKSLKRKINDLKLDTSHWTGQGWSKNKKYPIYSKSKSLKDILVENSDYNSNRLRLRLIEEKYFEHKCYKCNNYKWNDIPIILELEHINGDNTDNRIENLTILCPNCHAQTGTWRGRKNKGKIYVKDKLINLIQLEQLRNQEFIKEIKLCKVCNKSINKRNENFCSKSCSVKFSHHRKFEISKEELEKLIKEMPMTKIGKIFGVSDNAVKKRAKLLGIQLQDRRGYWSKITNLTNL